MALTCATKQHVTKLERERGRYSGKERGKKRGIYKCQNVEWPLLQLWKDRQRCLVGIWLN